jgi:hypothetical protein
MRAKTVIGQLAAALVVAAAMMAAAPMARATDVGVIGKRLVASQSASGKESIRSTQKDATVSFGSGSAASELSGTFEVFYVDAPSNRSTLDLPSPWLINTGIAAQFLNRQAPGGPTAVSAAKVVRAGVAQLVAKGLGGLDLNAGPGTGGVVTMFTVNNAGDSTTHRMCSLYRTASGSKLVYKRTSASKKLVLSKGVATPCPTCNDSAKNDRESDVDCGGPACQTCSVGEQCDASSDCDSGLCSVTILMARIVP